MDIMQITAELRAAFGQLDNAIEKWVDAGELLAAYLQRIDAALCAYFGEDSTPVSILHEGIAGYSRLLEELNGADQSNRALAESIGFLHWRMFILLNSFLQAVAEALAKFSPDEHEAIARSFRKSDWRPFFYDRLALDPTDVLALVASDLRTLEQLPRDGKGVMAALRIRNGITATLLEEYCPTHPLVYAAVQRLQQVNASTKATVIDEVAACLRALLDEIRKRGRDES